MEYPEIGRDGKYSKVSNRQSSISLIMSNENISIGVVIPTKNRPQLVQRAVNSAREQTHKNIEIIVVIDGEDRATVTALEAIADARIKIVQLPESKGGGAARNAGVKEARGEWIAFLDDDDCWLPTKLEAQLQKAIASSSPDPIVSCYVTAQTPKGTFTYPQRLPAPQEHLSEYLLVRNGLHFGEGLIQTSTIFTSKKLLQQVPFDENLAKHQDWDWILRANRIPGVAVMFVTQTLAIWYLWEKRQSISSSYNCYKSLDWIDSHRHLVTPKAYSSFLITQVAPQAASARQWQLFSPLLWAAWRKGQPRLRDILLYWGMWLIPRSTRRSLRSLLSIALPMYIRTISYRFVNSFKGLTSYRNSN